GKAPRTYRGLRKIWVAQDMATKNRTSHKPADLVYSPVPELALKGQPELLGGIAEVRSFAPVPSASAARGEGEGGKKGCGCRLSGGDDSRQKGPFAALAAALAVLARRRRVR